MDLIDLLALFLIVKGVFIMDVTNLMIRKFNIKELGYDFMGYSLQKNSVLTFDHLIIPNRLGGHRTLDNGAILCGDTAHTYLHLIELINEKVFKLITEEMIDMNIKRELSIVNLKRINEILCEFEKANWDKRNSKDEFIIKEKYKIRMFN